MMRKTLLAFCAAVTLLTVTPPAFTQEPASLPKVKLRPYHPAPHGITRETIRGCADEQSRGLDEDRALPHEVGHAGVET